MRLHNWLGRHEADVQAQRWERGSFVSRCAICSRPMEKLPGLGWQLSQAVR